MRRNHHRSPLQSFRFWFVLLSLFALAAAWKLDLFGNRRPGAKADLVDELPEPDPEVEPVAMLSDVTKPGSAARSRWKLTRTNQRRSRPANRAVAADATRADGSQPFPGGDRGTPQSLWAGQSRIRGDAGERTDAV